MNTTTQEVVYITFINSRTSSSLDGFRDYEGIKNKFGHIGEAEFCKLNSEGLWINVLSETEKYYELIVVVNKKDIAREVRFIETICRRCRPSLLVQVLKERNL